MAIPARLSDWPVEATASSGVPRKPQGEIRSNLKDLRLRANISLDEMAELTGVSRAELWRLRT